MGISQKLVPEKEAATVIPSVGCPMGCNFCSTSAMFGGKGHFINFYESGDELFDIMCQLERSMKTTSFFIMDENFLLHRRRALRLLELMERNGKAWSMFVFSSANALRTYSLEQLVSLGVSRVWMGLEGKGSRKARRRRLLRHVRELQSHGIHVLGSTIIGLEEHTPENIDEVIEHAVRYDSDFHQFMLYTPLPGTPLHAELSAQGRIKDEREYDVSAIHGQSVFNYRHPHISDGQDTELLLRAFHAIWRSTARRSRGSSARRWPDGSAQASSRRTDSPPFRLGGARPGHFVCRPGLGRHGLLSRPSGDGEKMSRLLDELYKEFGWKSRLYAAAAGRYVLRQTRREENGWPTAGLLRAAHVYGERGRRTRRRRRRRRARDRTTPPPPPARPSRRGGRSPSRRLGGQPVG